jgi:hypothetical protein
MRIVRLLMLVVLVTFGFSGQRADGCDTQGICQGSIHQCSQWCIPQIVYCTQICGGGMKCILESGLCSEDGSTCRCSTCVPEESCNPF